MAVAIGVGATARAITGTRDLGPPTPLRPVILVGCRPTCVVEGVVDGDKPVLACFFDGVMGFPRAVNFVANFFATLRRPVNSGP